MQVLLEIRRSDGQFVGSAVRIGDDLRADFTGVLELVAALEWLESGAAVRPESLGQDAVAGDRPASQGGPHDTNRPARHDRDGEPT